MKISKSLHLVIPVEAEAGELFVHSTPIGEETFKLYYMVLAKAFKEIYVGGPGMMGAPRVAAMVIEDVAKKMGVWEGEAGVEIGLIGEIRRLTNVMAPGPGGWGLIPFDDAVRSGLIDKRDASEVENAVCFFTLASSMHRKAEVEPIMAQVSQIWGGHVESLTCSEFLRSLPTSKGTESSTTKAALSVPS